MKRRIIVQLAFTIETEMELDDDLKTAMMDAATTATVQNFLLRRKIDLRALNFVRADDVTSKLGAVVNPTKGNK